MKLVYTKSQKGITVGQDVKVGDKVRLLHLGLCEVTFFRPPHKPSSEGKINLKAIGAKVESEFYVKVIGAEWIEREDRNESPLTVLRHHVTGAIERGESAAIVEKARPLVNEKPKTWKIVEVEVNQGKKIASITLTSYADDCIEIDVRILNDRKVIVECENLITGKGKGFFLEDQAMTAVITLK